MFERNLNFILLLGQALNCCLSWASHTLLFQGLRACSHGSGGPRRGEVPNQSLVKKYLSSHATPGTQGEVQNAITWSLSTHINKELSFVPMKLLFALMSLLQAKLQFDSADQPDYPIPRLNCCQHCQFHQCFGSFGGEIVEISHHARGI